MNGRLTVEMKDTILHLAGGMGREAVEKNTADVWSQLILELHGILSGGGELQLPLALRKQDEEEDDSEEEETPPKEDRSPKLKLVLMDNDGEEKEFSFNLEPKANGGSEK